MFRNLKIAAKAKFNYAIIHMKMVLALCSHTFVLYNIDSYKYIYLQNTYCDIEFIVIV